MEENYCGIWMESNEDYRRISKKIIADYQWNLMEIIEVFVQKNKALEDYSRALIIYLS